MSYDALLERSRALVRTRFLLRLSLARTLTGFALGFAVASPLSMSTPAAMLVSAAIAIAGAALLADRP